MAGKTDVDRMNALVNKVQEKFELKDHEKRKMERQFSAMCKGSNKDELTLEDAKKAAEESVNESYAKYPRLIAKVLRLREEQLDQKDLNKDGMVSKEEYIRGERFVNLLLSMNKKDDDFDLIMDKDELIKWVEELGVEEPALTAEAAIKTFLKASEKEVKTEELARGLYDMAFPKA